jgi:hypothetical protein
MHNIDLLLHSPTTSHWLRNALQSALDRDPVDAASDAALLSTILVSRADTLVQQHIRRAVHNHFNASES